MHTDSRTAVAAVFGAAAGDDRVTTRALKAVLMSQQGDLARTVAAAVHTCADSTVMRLSDEAAGGPLVPWHAARIPAWVALPPWVVEGAEALGVDRTGLALVVFQARDAAVASEDDLFVGVLPRPLDARIYRAPIVLALRVDVDGDEGTVAWLDMDAESCDLVVESWLSGPAADPVLGRPCARPDADADSSAMSTDDEGRGGDGALATTTTTDDDDADERQGADGLARVPKARRRAKVTPNLRRRTRRNSATAATASGDDDRSSHATDDEEVPAPRRRLKAPRRAQRRMAASDDDDDDDAAAAAGDDDLGDDDLGAVEGGPTYDDRRDDDDDACRDSDGDDVCTAEDDDDGVGGAGDDLGDDDLGDDDDDLGDDAGGAAGDMDDDLADDEDDAMDDDANAE